MYARGVRKYQKLNLLHTATAAVAAVAAAINGIFYFCRFDCFSQSLQYTSSILLFANTALSLYVLLSAAAIIIIIRFLLM